MADRRIHSSRACEVDNFTWTCRKLLDCWIHLWWWWCFWSQPHDCSLNHPGYCCLFSCHHLWDCLKTVSEEFLFNWGAEILFWSISLAVSVTPNLMVPCLSPWLVVEQPHAGSPSRTCFNNVFLKSGMGFLLSMQENFSMFTEKLLFMPYASEKLIQA